ncbi:nucleotide sugar dehydrogenase [Sphingobacterium hungaricum]|uniref:Vi polysaccharide biosynthesis protein VipA/TviB n=1 Tax=Sphingobacterium hungaricum TaxID=2082723 RepID=A0A928YSD7_9SPHI|nr:nucleotide sugar dehydrogenase [Sphingobacterium hungaricum]MBE8714133.1 Vi polysaccharide biosynthesis protein VipA/TviB [Sphingobacterium hungaricum]
MLNIAIIGQGYVGLPLGLAFANHFEVWGYDIDLKRIEELKAGFDRTKQVDTHLIMDSLHNKSYRFTSSISDISSASIYIVTVPTPIDKYNSPNLSFLLNATKAIAEILKPGDIVIYESTVYPGCTEEECVPILELYSGLSYNKDFFVGYSPERISPGDKLNTLSSIVKVTSGSTAEISEQIDKLYQTIVPAGTFKAPSIKVAEASKAIENAQRDVNISFVNELALIFDRIGIDTNDVLDAASTKFNFLRYQPGLVGGHCISVDPYYLAHKADQVGYHPDVILSGRRVNDSMAKFVASKVVKLMLSKDMNLKTSEALILGVTFKENCPDIRNTKVIDIRNELLEYGVRVDIFDPWADHKEVKSEYGVSMLTELDPRKKYEAVILAVAHDEFLTYNIKSLVKDISIVFDIKARLDRSLVDARL